MRYLMQLLIPALIFIAVVYLVMRARRSRSVDQQTNAEDDDGDKGMLILIIVAGAMVVVGVVFALQSLWGAGP